MTEITRVPLQPVAKGTLTKLWLGVLAVALAAAGLVFATMPAGVKVATIKEGTGRFPTMEDVVWIKYVGKTAADGKEFQRTPENPFQLPPGLPAGLIPDGIPMEMGKAVPGFTEGLLKVQKGGKYTFNIPAEKAYGANPPPESGIPANADLIFDIEVTDIMTPQQQQEKYAQAEAVLSKLAPGGPEGKAGEAGGEKPEGKPADADKK
ncbi:MAG: FKBP-type peptidyl-prolyl cis-trans isomerase [Novosphingobium sp.]|uniref:FKBP-type peptidyl-prolyl cis-trans isomerase n=1 Tax=Novosphingobium sp. TaxID=1874826 RepID=UPI0032BDF2A3